MKDLVNKWWNLRNVLNRLEVQDLAYVVGSVKDLRTENSSANVETNYRRRWKISGKSGPDGVGKKATTRG